VRANQSAQKTYAHDSTKLMHMILLPCVIQWNRVVNFKYCQPKMVSWAESLKLQLTSDWLVLTHTSVTFWTFPYIWEAQWAILLGYDHYWYYHWLTNS